MKKLLIKEQTFDAAYMCKLMFKKIMRPKIAIVIPLLSLELCDEFCIQNLQD
jgi:hypothetical protein